MTIGEKRAYAAALVDGEGTVRVQRQLSGPRVRYFPVVTVSNCAVQVLSFLKKHWGGGIRPNRKPNPTHRQSYVWEVKRVQAKEFLREILPYLIIKREQARLTLSCPLGKSGRDTTPCEYQKMDEIHRQITILNKRGRRSEQLQIELRTQEQLSLF